jgi:single-strand DNA-binding protein
MNSVQLIGNLTRDPEQRELPGGAGSVCGMRIAVNGRRRNRSSGEWEDDPNYFDVLAYGGLAAVCGEHLARGRRIAVTGRLEHREWTTDNGQRSTVEVVASDVDFLSPKPDQEAAPEPALA